MAKTRVKASVRDRAIAAWKKNFGLTNERVTLVARKSRSKRTITVSFNNGNEARTWSYEGGNLRRI